MRHELGVRNRAQAHSWIVGPCVEGVVGVGTICLIAEGYYIGQMRLYVF